MRTTCILLPLALAFGSLQPCAADDHRGAGKQPDTPLFTRHVQAVFSRLGCNGGACHGAVQGQNGFRLSLFSADPDLDYTEIARDEAGRRLDAIDPANSLLLLKAAGEVSHAGGRLAAKGTAEYDILRRWIEAGRRATTLRSRELWRCEPPRSRARRRRTSDWRFACRPTLPTAPAKT